VGLYSAHSFQVHHLIAASCPGAQRGFEGDLLGNTFSIAVFLGNGLIAILAGLLGHGLVRPSHYTVELYPAELYPAQFKVGVFIPSTPEPDSSTSFVTFT